MKITILLLLSFLTLVTSCASDPIGERRSYSSVRIASIVDGLYRVDITNQGRTYCFDTNSRGEKFYINRCENEFGVKIFSSHKDMAKESIRLVEESCGGIAMYVGSDSTQKYIGNSQVYCNSSASFGTVRTSCNGGDALYSHVSNAYFRCYTKPQSSAEEKEKSIRKQARIENTYSGFSEKEVDQVIIESEFFLPQIMRATMGDNQKGSEKYENLLRRKGYSLLGGANLQPVGDSNPYKTTNQKYGRFFNKEGYLEVFHTPEIIEEERIVSPVFGRTFCAISPENELSILWEKTFLLFKKQGGEPISSNATRSIVNNNYYYKWEFTSPNKDESGTTELSQVNKGCFSIITCMEITGSVMCENYKKTYEEMVRELIIDSLKKLKSK